MLPLLPALLLFLMHGPLGAPASVAGRAWRAVPAVGIVSLVAIESDATSAPSRATALNEAQEEELGSWVEHAHLDPMRLPGGAGDCVRSRDGPLGGGPPMAAVGPGISER